MLEKSVGTITVSLVSHGHAALVGQVLGDLAGMPEISKVVITVNIPDADIAVPDAFTGRVEKIVNAVPRGFGANHNAAFGHCDSEYFCVLNPDIRMLNNPFPALLNALGHTKATFVAPLIVNPAGGVEDSARLYPTPWNLLLRVGGFNEGRFIIDANARHVRPDWIAGMFMLFRAEAYRTIGGFDEGYFLYCEDIDICARLRRSGADFVLCPATTVVHDARRTSHRNLRYLGMHVKSLLRFFIRHFGRLRRTSHTTA